MLPEEEKERIEAALVRMETREVVRKKKALEGTALREWKREEEKKRGEGKKEFWLKKGRLGFLCFFSFNSLFFLAY